MYDAKVHVFVKTIKTMGIFATFWKSTWKFHLIFIQNLSNNLKSPNEQMSRFILNFIIQCLRLHFQFRWTFFDTTQTIRMYPIHDIHFSWFFNVSHFVIEIAYIKQSDAATGYFQWLYQYQIYYKRTFYNLHI